MSGPGSSGISSTASTSTKRARMASGPAGADTDADNIAEAVVGVDNGRQAAPSFGVKYTSKSQTAQSLAKGKASERSTEAPLVEARPADDGDSDSDGMDLDQNGDDNSPTMILLKAWRSVSLQKPIYHCFRNPKLRKYSCRLTLHFPPNGTRTFSVPASYSSKREAKAAASQQAIYEGCLEQARVSMLSMDRFGSSSQSASHEPVASSSLAANGPGEFSREERSVMSSVENPISALNLAVQKYCVEPPNIAVKYSEDVQQSHAGHYSLYRPTLLVRVTPEIHETYVTSAAFTSNKQAKESVTQLALQQGVIALLKLHNSMTTKICLQMGLPIPTSVEDHDPLDEENSAGFLGRLVQEVTRNPLAMQCDYTQAVVSAIQLYGACMTVAIKPDNQKVYEMQPSFRTKKEAKEAVCRLAIKSGLRRELEAEKRILDASHNVIRALSDNISSQPIIVPKPGTVLPADAHRLQNAVGYLNSCLQAFTGNANAATYDFQDTGPVSALGRSMGSRFDCTVTVQIPPDTLEVFKTERSYSTKKAAKEAAAMLAVRGGVVQKAQEVKASLNKWSTPLPSEQSGRERTDHPVALHAQNSNDLSKHHNASAHYRAADTSQTNMAEASPRLSVPSSYASKLISTQVEHHKLGTDSSPSTRSASPQAPEDRPSSDMDVDLPAEASQSTVQTRYPSQRLSAHYADYRPLSLASPTRTSRPIHKAVEGNAKEALLAMAQSIGPAIPSLLEFRISASPGTGQYGGLLQLRKGGEVLHTSIVSHRYPSRDAAEEAVSSRAVQDGIEDAFERAAIAKPAPPIAQEKGKGKETAAAPKLASSESIIFLEQIFRVLWNTEPDMHPTYELLKEEGGSEYGAILTIPLKPPLLYKVDTVHRSKRDAKAAVAEASLADGIEDKLKAYWLAERTRGTATTGDTSQRKAPPSAPPSSTAATGATQLSSGSSSSSTRSVTWTERLTLFCAENGKEVPQFTETISTTPGTPAHQELTKIAVMIGSDSFELDSEKLKAKGSAISKEKLAQLVLKNLMNRKATESTTSTLVS